MRQLVTVGNPNCGKTTLFNALTGRNQKVGNWSGVTVDKVSGQFSVAGETFELVDLPGIYSLDSGSSNGSVDEQIAFQYVMRHQPELVLNVVDATSLERNLYLTVQLLELGLPVVLVINKMDAAARQRLVIDETRLSQRLGCPVFSLCANEPAQVRRLKEQLAALQGGSAGELRLDYGAQLTEAQRQLAPLISEPAGHLVAETVAIKALEGDPLVLERLSGSQRDQVEQQRLQLAAVLDLDLQLADVRYSFIYQLGQEVQRHSGKLSANLTERLDKMMLHPLLGIPLFMAMMYLLFMFAINFGSAFIDFFDIAAGALLVDGLGLLLTDLGLPEWLVSVVAGGIGGGIQTVATFIPVIFFLYLGLSLLEGSGYLARAAFVIDGVMQRLGLPGKAFVPLLIGFGCNVPAIMAARTMETERERKLVASMAPFMSCGARLPVYALFAAAFFPDSSQNLVFALYLIGVALAMGTGLLLRHTLLPGHSDSLLLELPEYELPTLRNLLLKAWLKMKSFVFGAGKTIVLVVAVLHVLNSLGTDGGFGNENSDRSLLSQASKAVTPIFAPIGIREDNWPATVGLLTGVFAKEAVVGTLNSLYGDDAAEDAGSFSLAEQLLEAVNSIPQNLLDIDLTDPLGLAVDEATDLNQAAEAQAVSMSTFTNMQQQFDGKLGAFAYLLFVLSYTPCAAALGALVREFGRGWTLFVTAWTTSVAYLSATLVYQLGRFAEHPQQSLAYLLTCVVVLGVGVMMLKRRGRRQMLQVAL